MRVIKTRADFQALADVRLSEAKSLLDQRHWSGAYYLAGYSVELALKACIIKSLMCTDSFPDKKLSDNCYTHGLARLMETAQLQDGFKIASNVDAELLANWTLTQGWSEHTRYNCVDQAEAEELFAAIADPNHGVLQWLKSQW